MDGAGGGGSSLPQRSVDVPGTNEVSSPSEKWSLIFFYTSHFLFTWNDRVWEFASVILLIAAYPQTLLPSSLFGLITTTTAILFSPSIGRWFDAIPRLLSVRLSIITQRVTVGAGCLCLWSMVTYNLKTASKHGLFAVVIALGCIARLAFVGKTVSIERDWAIVISQSQKINLNNMNAIMRRIDLFCKLCGPLYMSVLTIRSSSFAALFLAASNVLSLPFEFYFISFVYNRLPQLAVKTIPPEQGSLPLVRRILLWPQRTLSSWRSYCSNPLFGASLAVSMLYFTVLSFGGSMITFLSQYSGFSTPLIAGLRAIAVLLGIAATFVSSPLLSFIGPARAGLWFLSWQTAFLIPAVVAVFLSINRRLQGAFLSGFVAVSRLGLWGVDLSEQYLVQQEIEAHSRAEFSTTEAALQSIFDVLQYTSTIIFPATDAFKWPVLMSSISVGAALAVYCAFVRKRRGHLLHIYKKVSDRDPRRSNDREVL